MGGMRGRSSAVQNVEGITAAGLLIEDLLLRMQEFLKPTSIWTEVNNLLGWEPSSHPEPLNEKFLGS